MVAVGVNVLGCDLAVFCHLLNQLFACYEAALTMGDCDGVDITDIVVHQPWRLVGSDSGTNQTGLMTVDEVVGQGWAGVICGDDFTEWNQTQFNQCLETVTDTAHQTIFILEQIHHSFGDLWVAEEGGDEFCGAFWFVTAGETAWGLQ